MTDINLMFSNKQTELVQSEILQSIKNVMASGQFIMGEEVASLERKLASNISYKHGIACANGTDALMLALMAFNLKQDEVVFTPSFTFIATAEAIAILGAKPYFVDVQSDGFNICIKSLEDSVLAAKSKGMKIRGVISVDLFGHAADYDAISKLTREHNLFFISDAAQSYGANHSYNAKPDIITTSFFPTKPLGCYGDGGMMFTDDSDIAEILRSITMHGKGIDKYHNVRIGTNSRLDTIQACVIHEKFKHFGDEIKARNKLAQFYKDQLSQFIQVPKTSEGEVPTWAVYTLLHKKRDRIIELLKKAGIPSNIYYHTPLHMQDAYLAYPRVESLVNSEKYSSECFCLPMHAYITNEERNYIVNQLKIILKEVNESN